MSVATPLSPAVIIACSKTMVPLQACILVGICFHFILATPAVEFERYMRRFLGAASIFSGGDVFVSIFFANRSLVAAPTHLFVPWSGFIIGLLLSLTIYRLFLHRCRVFPGPLAARLTRFYVSYLNAQEEQFHEKLRTIHAVYGDYARVGE
jgi:hypothetical protein